jgi:hypothetical protein
MNHSVYCLPTLTFHETKEENYTLYDALVAAVWDINITLPSSQKIHLEIQNLGNKYSLHILQKSVLLCQYEIDNYPHIFRRIWAVITVGFVDTARVEKHKNDIVAQYQYDSVNI